MRLLTKAIWYWRSNVATRVTATVVKKKHFNWLRCHRRLVGLAFEQGTGDAIATRAYLQAPAPEIASQQSDYGARLGNGQVGRAENKAAGPRLHVAAGADQGTIIISYS